MSTIADCITRTKRLIKSNTRTELDALNADITADATQINLKYQTDGIRAGSYISLEDGTNPPETMYVHSRNGEYITVSRSIDGSTANNWVADSVIEVEPRFSGFQIVEAIRDSIKSMPNNLYAVGTTTVSFASTSTQSVTATDMTLRIVEMLREHGVVGKFVEFYGSGLSNLTLPDRATIANMSPEYGATCGFFPVDDETLSYLRGTGRPESLVQRVERYCKTQGLFRAGRPAGGRFLKDSLRF